MANLKQKKNWEKEMSYKLRADQIRTINKDKYRFSVNGKEWQSIESMLQVSLFWIRSWCQ